jgi:penicillin-binding protein 2
MFGEEDLVKTHDERNNMISIIIICSFALVIARLCYLQIYKGDLLYQYSVENRLREEILRAPRGIVYSRDGKVIVNNNPRFDAIVTRQYLIEKEKTIKRLSEILKIPVELIQRIIKRNSSYFRGNTKINVQKS